MDKNLLVPYLSQEDPDANLSKNECGPSSVAMILNFYGEHLTPNQVFEDTGAGNGLETVANLQTAITKLGYHSDYLRDQTFVQLKACIDKNLPVIALVNTKYLTSREDKGYEGGHFFVVVGYRPDEGVYVNDPDFYGNLRSEGDHHNYTAQEFMAAWGNCHEDQNPDYSFIVIYPNEKAQTTPPAENTGGGVANVASTMSQSSQAPLIGQVTVTTTKPLRGRSTPKIEDGNIVTSFSPGGVMEVLSKVEGDNVSGISDWYLVEVPGKDSVYVWGGGVDYKADLPSPSTSPEQSNVTTPTPRDSIAAIQTMYKICKDILVENNALPTDEVNTTPTGFWAKVKEAFHII